jgi:integrase
MASLSKISGKRGTTWRIDFTLSDDSKRKYIRLGKMDKRQAESIKTKIETLIAATVTATIPDLEISRWVADRDDKFHKRLVKAGLVAPRTKVQTATLSKFLDEYIAGRTDIKPNTRSHLRRARSELVAYFGEDKALADVTPGDADEFRRQLRGADNTIRRTCGRAKQFFRAALRKRLISESPFADMKNTSVRANRSRDYFVTRKESEAVLGACPDNQWRLLFAFCRFGGMRCPSEPLTIRWGDVDWEHDRIHIDSPKTGPRDIPIFPELRPYLETAWDDAPVGSEFVITRYRKRNSNLRTHLCRIIRKAKLTPWPKLFQNLRSTRETELLNEGWKIHQVCAWIGNSQPIAMEHYLQVTATDFAKAAGKDTDAKNGEDRKAHRAAPENMQELKGIEQQGAEQECENPGDFENRRDSLVLSAPPVGLEPTT